METKKRKEEWQNKFNQCLAKEFSNPQYFVVHHLLVLSYMIQCDEYNDEYKEKVHTVLSEFNNGKDPKEILKRNNKWFVNKEIIKQETHNINFDKWSTTIMDIRLDTSENYCKDVRKWAKEIESILSYEDTV